MSGHFVKDIWLKTVEGKEGILPLPKNQEVWIHSKGTNDDRPFEAWHCELLTKVYREEGLIGLSIEITHMINRGDAQLHGKVKVSRDRLLKMMKETRESGTYVPYRKP